MPFSGTGAMSGAAAGSSLGLPGTLIGSILGGFFGGGKKAAPTIPFTPVNLQDEQKKAIAGNLDSEVDIEKLLAQGNDFTQQQAIDLMEKAMPGYGALSKKLTGTASDLLTNPYDLPQDVQANLSRIAAEKGVTRGTGGQFNQFSLLRDLGLNSLDYGQQRIQQGQNIYSLLASTAPKVNPMSPISLYATPAQQANVAQSNNAVQQEIAQGGANAATAARNANDQSAWQNLTSIIALNKDAIKQAGGKVMSAI